MTDSRLARQTAERLIGSRAQLLKFNGLLGFDGLVESCFEVADQRPSVGGKQATLSSLAAFAKELTTNKKTSFEVTPVTERIAGDGPLMTFAMSTLGAPVDYVGPIGTPTPHPVFSEFSKRARVHSLGQPGLVSTYLFADGTHYTLSQLQPMNEIHWEGVKKRVGEKTLQKAWNEAHFIGLLNWSLLPHMSAIWKKLLSECKPGTKDSRRRLVFFDLGDSSKRIEADLLAALKIVGEFQDFYDIILGMNEAEALHVAKVLRLKVPAKTPKGYASLAGAIREKLELATVVIHPQAYACGADSEGEHAVEGPFTAKPKITTGAGAHFNAGLVIAKLLGLSLPHALQLGVACSGFYVRHAASPNREQLVRFLQTL